ncbi:MAG: hypothetical protein ACI83P_001116 [Janthinobacterium sp.]|jgi:hypothetical protein
MPRRCGILPGPIHSNGTTRTLKPVMQAFRFDTVKAGRST